MLFLVLSNPCQDRLKELCNAYEESTGQVLNPADFLEYMILRSDIQNLLELISEDL